MNTGDTSHALSCIEVDPGLPPQAVVIWLHGLGADGHDFEPLAPQLQAHLTIPTRFVFPHAPRRPVTINNGYIMRAWYDIAALDLSQAEDGEGIHKSAELLDCLIQREIQNGVASHHIVLAGFSQGGAIALHVGLRYPQRLAGILALSSYLPLAATVAAERHAANRNIPIFMGHGSEDTVVSLSHALASRELMVAFDYALDWHTYEMAHSVCQDELNDIADWLSRTLTT